MNSTPNHRQRQRRPFPLHEESAIRQCFNHFGVRLPPRLFECPSREDALYVFMETITLALNKNVQDLKEEEVNSQVHFKGLDVVSDGGRHHFKAIGVLRIVRYVQNICQLLGYSNFSLNDIINPTVPGLRGYLSSLTEFLKYRQTRLEDFHDLMAEADDARQSFDKYEDSTARLLHQKASLEREIEAGDVVRIRAERQAHMERLKGLHNKLMASKSAGDESGIRIEKMECELREIEFQVLRGRQLAEELKAKIVSSPAKLQQCLEALKERHAAERARIKGTEIESRQYAVTTRTCQAALNLMESHAKALKDLDASIVEANTVQEKQRSAEEELEKLQTEVTKTQALEKKIDDKLAATKRRFANTEAETRRVDEAANEELKDAQHEQALFCEEQMRLQEEIANLDSTLEEMKGRQRREEMLLKESMAETRTRQDDLLTKARTLKLLATGGWRRAATEAEALQERLALPKIKEVVDAMSKISPEAPKRLPGRKAALKSSTKTTDDLVHADIPMAQTQPSALRLAIDEAFAPPPPTSAPPVLALPDTSQISSVELDTTTIITTETSEIQEPKTSTAEWRIDSMVDERAESPLICTRTDPSDNTTFFNPRHRSRAEAPFMTSHSPRPAMTTSTRGSGKRRNASVAATPTRRSSRLSQKATSEGVESGAAMPKRSPPAQMKRSPTPRRTRGSPAGRMALDDGDASTPVPVTRRTQHHDNEPLPPPPVAHAAMPDLGKGRQSAAGDAFNDLRSSSFGSGMQLLENLTPTPINRSAAPSKNRNSFGRLARG